MKKRDLKRKNAKKNQNVQFEEMEKAEEFGATDFAIGFGVGLATGTVALIVLT